MPRLSLYKPERGTDYDFLDRQILEMFTIGGTDLHVHKYLGPENPDENSSTADQPRYVNGVSETNIQDLLFLENRDRKYDPDIYRMRGIYNVQDIDFNLSQFGLFLDNDTLFLTIHINSSVKTLGRKIMSGDVIELPHLKDEYALNDYSVALKRFYVVEDVNRAAEGFSPTWYPHLYRLKLKQIVDSQEFADILDLQDEDDADGNTLRDLLSTYEKEMQINDAVVAQAEADAPKSGYDISHYYTLEVQSDETGSNPVLTQVSNEYTSVPASKAGYQGYLLGSEQAPDGTSNFGHGLNFPFDPTEGDYFLRTDFSPKRLFRYDGAKWVKVQDDVRMTMTNTDTRSTQKGTFINNDKFVYNDKVAADTEILTVGATTIVTDIAYPVTALYLVLKFDTLAKEYVIADHPTLLEDEEGKVKINLPILTVNDSAVQDTINYSGQWDIYFYNNREAEKTSLSEVLRPKADN